MRVEVVFETGEPGGQLEIPWESEDSSNSYADLRENAKAIDRLEAARQHPPLRSLLMAVNSGDSIFSTARSKTWLAQVGATATEPCEFASRVDLVFAAEPFNLDGGRFASLTQRLQELLAREASPDTQRCELRVCPCHFRAGARKGLCLRILLYARGATPEQARLRWGIGLARIQQALLFTSRVLRQQIAQAS